jgi:PAS domain S-box-containing protein
LSDSAKTRKALLEDLSELWERLGKQVVNAALLRASLDAIITMGYEGKVVDLNAAAETMFGYSQVEVGGKELSELIIPPQFRESYRQGLARHTATGESSILNKRLEMLACRRNGSVFSVELTITRMEGEEHPLFIGFIRDITEQKALQDDQARLSILLLLEGPSTILADVTSGLNFAPRFRRSVASQQEHLHHRAGRERLHHGSASRLDFRCRLSHFHARDSFDLLPQRVGGVCEQLSVELLHLSRACRTLGQDSFGR